MAEKIRSAARRSAWYRHHDDGIKTYNFFGRFRPQYDSGDEESRIITHVQSESDITCPVESNRRSRVVEEAEGFRGPPKASTFPDGPNGNMPPYRGDNGSVEKPSEEYEAPRDLPDDTPPRSEDARGGDVSGQPRQRKVKKLLGAFGGKKQEETDQGALRSDTGTSSKSRRRKPTVGSQMKTVFYSPINILLLVVPVGIALHFTNVNKIAVFVVNFLAIIPLAAMLSFATEELALYIGEVTGGLLNATFGNAVELIVGVIALTQGKILIVQTSLIGSMLSNLLLVMGMCFFFGGINRIEQHFNITVAQTATSLLALAIGSLVIPTAYKIFVDDNGESDSGVTPVSRGTAVMLLVVYGCYLLFQLRTHVSIYNEPSKKSPKRSNGRKEQGDASSAIAAIGAGGAATAGGQVNQENLVQEKPDEPEDPQLTRVGALVTLAGATVLIALCAEFMVSAINAVTAAGVSEEFVGLILLPIVGNAAEHATAVTVAIKDKMDLAIGVAVGSSLQIALLVLPIMVMLSWFTVGSPEVMTLNFDGFQVVVLFIAIILVNYLIQDGKSHWLEGVLLQIAYLIIALAAWFYPTTADVAG